MRATEQSYIARGHAMRVDELGEELRRLVHTTPRAYAENDSIGLYALVTLTANGKSKRYYLTPFGGGNEVSVDAQKIMVLAPSSPLGEGLMGLSLGDTITLANSEWNITGIE